MRRPRRTLAQTSASVVLMSSRLASHMASSISGVAASWQRHAAGQLSLCGGENDNGMLSGADNLRLLEGSTSCVSGGG
eukprot:364203-Chlamydomonas_euryale.AAC.2